MVEGRRFFFEQVALIVRAWSHRLEIAKAGGDILRKEAMAKTNYDRLQPFNDLMVADNYGKRYGMSPGLVLEEPNYLVYSVLVMDQEVQTNNEMFKEKYRTLRHG